MRIVGTYVRYKMPAFFFFWKFVNENVRLLVVCILVGRRSFDDKIIFFANET